MCALRSHSSCDSYLTMGNNRRKTSMRTFTFVVDVRGESLATDEFVAVFGEAKELGAWDEQRAVRMRRSNSNANVWWASVNMPPHQPLRYRYFIATLSMDPKVLRVRCWESNVHPRHFRLDGKALCDCFGMINLQQRVVHSAWLNTGHIVQFKVFGGALKQNGANKADMRIKIEPVDSKRLTTLPSVVAESVHLSSGNSRLGAQPAFGMPYKPGDMLMFQAWVPERTRVVFLVTLFIKRNPFSNSLLGYQYVYPQMLPNSEGEMLLALISTDCRDVISHLHLQYLVISAMPRWHMSLNVVLAHYWRPTWCGLNIGHRGLGRSLSLSADAPPLTENTLGAFIEAAKLHADMVQLDVQLTKDLVPIVYSDFTVKICSGGNWAMPEKESDLTEILVADYNYDELMAMRTFQVVNTKIVPYIPNMSDVYPDNHLFPTLKDVLDRVQRSLGLNIDIKWPQQLANGTWPIKPKCDKNVYVDSILDVVMRHGYGRYCFFSSLDADICSMLRLKQNMFPVMLRFAGRAGSFADPRVRTLRDVFSFERCFDLLGVVLNAAYILHDARYVQMARQQGLVVVAWGDYLNEKQAIERCKSSGVAGVIFDRIDKWYSNLKTNVFASDTNWQYLMHSWMPKFSMNAK